MDEAAENLIIKPARAVNPKVKLIIKFPNWYEHFQGLGYDLDREPKLFDGIYTGTETRDPVITDQHLQQYESYEIIRYFENITPGRNGGGWVDTYSIRYIDRYAEQLWDTMFAKARQMMLFEWSAMSRPIQPGDRADWQDLHTSFDYNQLLQAWTNSPRQVAGTHHRPRRRLCPGTGGPVPRQTRQSHRHRQLQTVSIHRRGFPAQLSRHDRHSHRAVSRISRRMPTWSC